MVVFHPLRAHEDPLRLGIHSRCPTNQKLNIWRFSQQTKNGPDHARRVLLPPWISSISTSTTHTPETVNSPTTALRCVRGAGSSGLRNIASLLRGPSEMSLSTRSDLSIGMRLL